MWKCGNVLVFTHNILNLHFGAAFCPKARLKNYDNLIGIHDTPLVSVTELKCEYFTIRSSRLAPAFQM